MFRMDRIFKISIFNVINFKDTETGARLCIHLGERFLVQGASEETW